MKNIIHDAVGHTQKELSTEIKEMAIKIDANIEKLPDTNAVKDIVRTAVDQARNEIRTDTNALGLRVDSVSEKLSQGKVDVATWTGGIKGIHVLLVMLIPSILAIGIALWRH